MNKKFCDRCGKEINTNPMMQCQNPLFEIRQIYPQGIMPIDLCEDCSKKFVKWVKADFEEGKKDEPKAVRYEGDGYADGAMVYDTAFCPNCEHNFEEDSENWGCDFCPNCGQRLRWEE